MSRHELSSLGAAPDMIEGISSELILTAGTWCAAFLHEDKENEWRVSLRSGNLVDVSRIAETLGGGGHIRAAGCTVYGKREEVLRLVETEMTRYTK
jgi:phosphoesterase RecJ-like protein